MSTTVTYKGSTLTTVDNQTRTLKTAGKYMEGDVTLTDVSSTILVTETYDTGGGIIKTITTTGTPINLQAKTIIPTTSIQTVNPDTGYNGFSQVVVNAASGSDINNQDKIVNPSTSQQLITADSGYTGLGTVTVTAMPIMTLPTTAAASATSGYTSKLTISRSTSDQYINIPTGYNSAGAYYKISAVANGTEGTPTATKGTVSNHSVSVTPSVTNTAGYISGSTKMGTAVTVSASELVSGTLSVTSNGTKDVTNYASVNVNISSEAPTIQSLSVTPSESAQTFNASGVDGYKPVSVDAIPIISDYVIQIADESFYTENNNRKYRVRPSIVSTETGYLKFTRYASKSGDYRVYNAVASDIIITPTESSQTIGGAQYIMEGSVTIAAISSNYVGSGITQRSSTDLTASGATVSVPAGYYAEAASKSVSSMTLPTAAASSATSGYTSKATIGRSTAAQYINIPPGYNSTGAYYVISAVANGSATAPASISGTAASVSTGNGTLTLTKTVSVTPSVTAGYISSGTAGNSSVSLTASVTIDPTPTASGATVTIPAGYYTDSTTKSVSSGSATGPTSLSGSSATITTGTNTITLTKTGVTTTPTVSAGYVSSATASTATVTLTASVTTKAAATITPTTTNQTIAAGTYLTGVQTIAGDANLVASNIVSGVQIFGVTGNVVLQNYYTGSSAPSSSLGSNGDLYLQS